MIKTFLIAFCALAFTACSSLSINNPLGPPQMAAVLQTYKVALDAGVAVVEARTCKRSEEAQPIQNVCAPYATKLAVQSAIRNARAARQALTAFVRKNPTLDASALVRALADAVSALNAARGV